MSSVVGYLASSSSSSPEGHDDGNNERLDFVRPTTTTTTPDLSLSGETFLHAAVSLKDQVVKATCEGEWSSGMGFDPNVYTGLMGTAFTCLRSYEATGNRQDLLLCAEIADKCAAVARVSARHMTFLCGRGGVYALGAVVANLVGDQQRRDLYLNLFLEVAQEKALSFGPEEGGFGMSYDLLYGRAGFLWAALFINKHFGEDNVPSELLMPIVDAVLAGGRAGASDNPSCPLMYRWHGTRYLGAANGVAGISQVLLHFSLSDEDAEDVKGTLSSLRSHFETPILSAPPPRTLQSSPDSTSIPWNLPYSCSAHTAVSIDRLVLVNSSFEVALGNPLPPDQEVKRTQSTFSSSARWHARNSPFLFVRYSPPLHTLRIVAKTMVIRFPHSGNYPSSEGNLRDEFVQWSHGAAGMAITLCKASQVFPGDRDFRDAAIEAGEVVWKSGLLKKVGLADGVAGNAYAFLSLYRLTGESIYEERVKAFVSFL